MRRYLGSYFLVLPLIAVLGHACSPIAPSFDKKTFLKANRPETVEQNSEIQPHKDINSIAGSTVQQDSKAEPPVEMLSPTLLARSEIAGFDDLLEGGNDILSVDLEMLGFFKKERRLQSKSDWNFTPKEVLLILDIEDSNLVESELVKYKFEWKSDPKTKVWELAEAQNTDKTHSYLVRDKIVSAHLFSSQDALNRFKKELAFYKAAQRDSENESSGLDVDPENLKAITPEPRSTNDSVKNPYGGK